MQKKIKIIGAGLAGTECALYLAERGIKVTLCEMKPVKFTPAHKDANFSELVCSNSLKSNDIYGNAAGLLKQEMRILGSAFTQVADATKVPAGNALAVNRELFAKSLTERVKANKNITVEIGEVTEIDKDCITVIATGPLTSDALGEKITEFVGGGLSFFDASAPIIAFESIDMTEAFFGDRYGKGGGDHINCPMNKEQYAEFITQLKTAKKATLHDFEDITVFEGCMPVEVMAERGDDTLRFGPLKPRGLDDPRTGRWPYACLQLRREDSEGSMYNMVGFQTNLLWGEQKRVFGIIPALKNAEYLRYGVMHRNTFINSPKHLNADYSLKTNPDIYFAGQITGVEGYVESAASGLAVAIHLERKIKGRPPVSFADTTVMGALSKYITTENKDFEPMNANFGILPSLGRIVKDKAERKREMAIRSISQIESLKKEIENHDGI